MISPKARACITCSASCTRSGAARGLVLPCGTAGECRAREIANTHPQGMPKFIQVEPYDTEKDLIALLEARGYQPVRYEDHMVRDLSEPLPEAPMPPGLEVRPVKPEHMRHIFEASNEAFRDHWGSRDESEEEYKSFTESPLYRPELWKVAWDGDQMAAWSIIL